MAGPDLSESTLSPSYNILSNKPESPEYPQPTAEEKALQRAQADILIQQKSLIQDASTQLKSLQPILFQAMGLRPSYDDQGNITGFSPEEGFQRRIDIQDMLLKRQEAALKGELPVNPALLRDLAEQEQTLKEGLRKQLGSGFETSSAGIEALTSFQQRRLETLENARRGDLTLAAQLGPQFEQQISGGALGLVTAPAALPFGQAAAGFNQPLAGLAEQRRNEFNAALNAQQVAAEQSEGVGSLVGKVVGLFI